MTGYRIKVHPVIYDASAVCLKSGCEALKWDGIDARMQAGNHAKQTGHTTRINVRSVEDLQAVKT